VSSATGFCNVANFAGRLRVRVIRNRLWYVNKYPFRRSSFPEDLESAVEAKPKSDARSEMLMLMLQNLAVYVRSSPSWGIVD
jgi:hypothetical protein